MQYRSFSSPALLAIAAALTIAGCSSGNELAIDVRTDLVPGDEFDAVRVSLDEAEPSMVTARAGDEYARPHRVAERSGVASGRHTIDVELTLRGSVVVARRVAVRMEGSLIVVVVLTRDCRGVTCPGAGGTARETECVGGRCVDPECSALDPMACGSGECDEDADCTSTVACVAPQCIEGACLDLPGDGTCPPTDYCHPVLGCTPLPMSGDGGMVDGGMPPCMGDTECDDGIACTIDSCVSGACSHALDDTICTEGIDPRCDPSAPLADEVTGCASTECSADTCRAGPCETAECFDGRCERASTCADGEMCCAGGICGSDCDEATACVGLAAGTLCRAARDLCDAEERCDGSSPGCPPDELRPATHTCRPATGTCDRAELCSGSSDACPVDAFEPLGTTCSGGTCNGLGACLTGCTPGGACSTGNICERGMLDCSGASPRCVRAGFEPSSTVCRSSAGPCDVAERCTGSSATCPGDGFAGSSVTCRPAAGACDVAETCNGGSPDCPADGYRSGSFECRGTAGTCDIPEFCPGSGPDCPGNSFRPSSYECRASAGVCDVAETCSGSGAACPGDSFRTGTTCRTSAGVCDVAEVCSGASAACPGDAYATSGQCRASAGTCDVAESCNGSGPSCPADGYRPSSYVCRGASGICDIAETCTGSSTTCPVDGMAPGGDYGEACCPGSQCREGACLNGRCVAFGGVYALYDDDGGTVCHANPVTLACSCPAGFIDELLEDLDGNTDEGNGWLTHVHHCRAPSDVPGADYRGGSGQRLAAPTGTGCTASCWHPNAFTGACSCPSGSTSQDIYGVHYMAGTSDDCQRQMRLCRGSAPLTFGGAYRQMTETNPSSYCLTETSLAQRCEPNPYTGGCYCPTGFVGVTMPAFMRHPTRYTTNWHCRADLTICVDTTP